MRPEDGSLPGRRMAQEGLARVRQAVRAASLPAKILLVLAVLIIIVLALSLGARFWDVFVVAALVYGPVAIWRGHRSWVASVFVAAWGLLAVVTVAAVVGRFSSGIVPLLLLPCAAVAVSHLPLLSRRYVPCRTVAWTQLWALPPGLLAWWLAPSRPVISYAIAWLLGLAVVGWRMGKSQQEARALSRQQSRSGALAAPHRAGPAMAARPAGWPTAAGNGRTSRPAEVSRVVQTAEGSVRPAEGAAGRDRASGEPQPPEITVAQAMAELDNMIGLASVKDQIRQITASVEAARRRVMAGYGAEKPMQHFVFLGPPGTGKTSVARVVAKIFYAFGLLDTPVVVEAQRADLVGEYLGATAIKTNELVNRRARRGPVHRRGVQPGERQRRAGRPVRPRGDPGAAETGRGRPDRAHHHPGRLREADGGVPGQQPRPQLPVRAPGRSSRPTHPRS